MDLFELEENLDELCAEDGDESYEEDAFEDEDELGEPSREFARLFDRR